MGLSIVFRVCCIEYEEISRYEQEKGEMQVDFIWGVEMEEMGVSRKLILNLHLILPQH